MCNALSWTLERCNRDQRTCDSMGWDTYISLHKMPSDYRWGWMDRSRDMPPD